MLRFTLVLLLLAPPAFAFETDCPLEDPENPGHMLSGGFSSNGNFATHSTRRGDVWHDTEILEQWQERGVTLNCQYGGPQGRGRNIVLEVPGLITRCDWLARDVLKPQPVEPGTGGPIDHVFLRIWCTSRR
jgi:hypothetical protein